MYTNLNKMKTRIFKNNEGYFRFIKKEGIKVYLVKFTKNHNIKVYYKSRIVKKNNKESKEVCV